MKPAMIASTEAPSLLPLLRSIGEEILERAAQAAHLERMIDALSAAPRAHAGELAVHRAELADVKRELRHAEEELTRLGCRIDGFAPLTFRIRTAEDEGFTWRLGDESLEEVAS